MCPKRVRISSVYGHFHMENVFLSIILMQIQIAYIFIISQLYPYETVGVLPTFRAVTPIVMAKCIFSGEMPLFFVG